MDSPLGLSVGRDHTLRYARVRDVAYVLKEAEMTGRQTGRERRQQVMEHGTPLRSARLNKGTWVFRSWSLCYFLYLFVTFKLLPNDTFKKFLCILYLDSLTVNKF